MSKLDDICQAIANGHAYKHVERGEFKESSRYGKEVPINTTNEEQGRREFADHIKATLDNPDTICFKKQNGNEFYYNKETNTVVAFNPENVSEGTCYRPTAKDRCVLSEFSKDVGFGGSNDPTRIKEGGYLALHPEQAAHRSGEKEQQPEYGSSSEPPKSTKSVNIPPTRGIEESTAAAVAQGFDLSQVNLPRYAETEHGYRIRPHAEGMCLLEKDGERLRAQRDSEGNWSYENPRKDSDNGTIVDFAARRGGSEAGIADYLKRNPDEARKAQEAQKAAEEARAKVAEQAAARKPDGRDE